MFAPETTGNGLIGDWSSLFRNRSILNPDKLTLPFSPEEIKEATFQLGGDKAPRPDGFNLRFFQRFWDVVMDDLYNVFSEIFNSNLNTGPLDYSYICLIPKK